MTNLNLSELNYERRHRIKFLCSKVRKKSMYECPKFVRPFEIEFGPILILSVCSKKVSNGRTHKSLFDWQFFEAFAFKWELTEVELLFSAIQMHYKNISHCKNAVVIFNTLYEHCHNVGNKYNMTVTYTSIMLSNETHYLR